MKKIISVFLSINILICTLFSFEIAVKASTFTDKVEAFTYKNYNIPAYDGDSYEILNNNIPKFETNELNQVIFEEYGELDELGRVTQCVANIDQSLMPDSNRGSISSVYPTGWVQKQYDFISGKYLYNRSHLIGWQLTGENANKKNLMTGTRSFNTPGMLEFENKVADYIKQDEENNVLYRVTPVFRGDNMLASGVIMEAESVDDYGDSVRFCVFVYNVQEGVSIDYSTGESVKTENTSKGIIESSSVLVDDCTYNGKAQKPIVIVKVNSKKLTENVDYKLSYLNNINAGTAKVCVEGMNGYSGKVIKNFKIFKAKYTPNISSQTYTYDAKAHSIKISGVKSGSQIKYKTSKESTYSTRKPNRKSVGKTVIYYSITNPNYYTINGNRSITIVPKNVSEFKLSNIKTGFKVSWKKQSVQTTGYSIRYSTYSDMKNSKTVAVSNNKSFSRTIKNLKKDRKYYVQIRTYKKVYGTNYYSAWSTKKSIVVKS